MKANVIISWDFAGMWMSDKRLVQEELAVNLSLLVHEIPNVDLALSFMESFLRTMQREWHGIDGYRLDKFYSLIRKMVYQSLCLLNKNDWNEQLVLRFTAIISNEVIYKLPNGLRMHLSDLYLNGIHQAGAATIKDDTFVLLLQPFFKIFDSIGDRIFVKRVADVIFR